MLLQAKGLLWNDKQAKYWKSDFANGYIFMAQETSDNIWVSKKYFSEYQ